MTRSVDERWSTVRIPADIDQEDRLVGPFTARQTLLLGATLLVLWLGYLATRAWIPVLAYLALTLPVAAVAVVAGLARRDGMTLDRLFVAAVRHARAPKRLAPAPDVPTALPDWLGADLVKLTGHAPAPLELPAIGVDHTGVLDLGRDGAAALAVCSTVNFALRTGVEQEALSGAFGRWLNAATGPVQLVVRAHRLDLAERIATLREGAPALPHPRLEAAARAHADFVETLAEERDLLVRQVLLVVRDPGRARPVQRLLEAARALAAADVAVRALDGGGVTALVHAACDPDADLPAGGFAASGATVTAAENAADPGTEAWN